ncbi:MAG: amidophosphoribosyltransferase [Oscillospiraceae bacterium]|jgi:amidophosphoribosyltransferase|nr:amidophosphoribosyltransferase [Oscillospiraceae bacterium]
MGGIFGVCSSDECATDLFFGTDYHSHLGTRRGGMAVCDGKHFTRAIHNIENTPFRTKFESDISELKGNTGVGCISDSDPQPIVLHSRIGVFAVVTVGRINNKWQLAEQLITRDNAHFSEMSGGRVNDTELVASLICRRGTIAEGIEYAQSVIEGSMTMLVCADGGIYAARDKLGRTPLSVGRKDDGRCVSFESFAYINLGYQSCYELGPGEIVFVTADAITQLVKPGGEMRVCTFLWTYYGYPTSGYEGVNVEEMRYRCGGSLAEQDRDAAADYVAGVPDSGTAHAIGYASRSGIPFARPLIKYTPTWPRSFTPKDQSIRNLIARMKLVPIRPLIEGKKLIFVEDSIVRGTQMRGTVYFLHTCGARELHVRSASPPVLYSCKYLNFTRSTSEEELVSRQVIRSLEGADGEKHIAEYADRESERYRKMVDAIRAKLSLPSLEYHSLDGLLGAAGIDRCKLCTYCWNGNE